MIHSAFKGFARDGYAALEVLEALLDYMRDGTLVLPSMSWRSVNLQNPIFDELTTPSNTGILCEIFRTQFATHRSLHPTHSVCAVGAEAAAITATHHLSHTPCDKHSPFIKIVELSGSVLMLGVGIDCCTILHAAEENTAPDVYVKPEYDAVTYTCIAKDKTQQQVQLRRHLFLPRNYWVTQDLLAQRDQLSVAASDSSIVLGFNARTAFDLTCAELCRDPRALIARPGQRYRMM